MGPSAKPEAGFSRYAAQFVEYEPHKKLRLAPVRMPKRQNTAAFSAQSLFIGPEDMFASPQHYLCYTQYKKKVEPAENSAYKKDEFRDFGFRNLNIRSGVRNRLDIGFVH
jgi:hypothetical protein